ncbi:MAG: hypothetical protein WDW36_004466 [Sanguina aurantia]
MRDLEKMLTTLSLVQKRLILVAILSGGVAGGHRLRSIVKRAQADQKRIVSEGKPQHTKLQTQQSFGGATRVKQKIAVDKLFFQRLVKILSICVPSVFSREAMLIMIQGVLLVSRTLLTDWIARVEGYSGSTLVSQNFGEFRTSLIYFAGLGVPAAIVNSGLKYMQKKIELAFQLRLTKHLHRQYCSNRAYYAASMLGGMTNADQRLTEDVEKFSYAASELYSHTFKPLLDVILHTRSLSRVMGYQSQFALYAYYVVAAYLLRSISPPLAQMTAQEASLSGSFRAAHQRLVTNAEEVAFNDPPSGAAEQLVLNQHLRKLVDYSKLSAVQRGLQQIADGYFIKYFASVTALVVYALPIYYMKPELRGDQISMTQNYIRSMRLLQNTSRGVGDLILVYKRISMLASHTGRVAELAEKVSELSAEDAEHKELFRKNISVTHMLGLSEGEHGEPSLPPLRLTGACIKLNRVALDSPDGTPLVRELSFGVTEGSSVMLMGPNGCGKSSLFRVMAGLWPLLAGEITTPSKAKVFFLSQRPYLVTGSLRDQLLYPSPPRSVFRSASPEEKSHFAEMAAPRELPPRAGPELDAELERCLVACELGYLLTRGVGWDQVQPWHETLSGGEKQRLAMARLLYHKPTFAVLDECTSAVSADGELKLYQECDRAGITFLSIAHRPALKRFHSSVIHFDGSKTGASRGWTQEFLDHALDSSVSTELAALSATGGSSSAPASASPASAPVAAYPTRASNAAAAAGAPAAAATANGGAAAAANGPTANGNGHAVPAASQAPGTAGVSEDESEVVVQKVLGAGAATLPHCNSLFWNVEVPDESGAATVNGHV